VGESRRKSCGAWERDEKTIGVARERLARMR